MQFSRLVFGSMILLFALLSWVAKPPGRAGHPAAVVASDSTDATHRNVLPSEATLAESPGAMAVTVLGEAEPLEETVIPVAKVAPVVPRVSPPAPTPAVYPVRRPRQAKVQQRRPVHLAVTHHRANVQPQRRGTVVSVLENKNLWLP